MLLCGLSEQYSSIYSLQSSTQRLPIRALFGFMLKLVESYSSLSSQSLMCGGLSLVLHLGSPHVGDLQKGEQYVYLKVPGTHAHVLLGFEQEVCHCSWQSLPSREDKVRMVQPCLEGRHYHLIVCLINF